MSDDLHRTFTVGPRVRIEASTGSGDIVVSPGTPGTVAVRVDGGAGSYLAEQSGDSIIVKPAKSGFFSRFGGADVFLEVPEGAELSLSCSSGDTMVNVSAQEIEASSASGDIRVQRIERSGRLRCASGDISVGDVGEGLVVTSASGSIRVGEIGRTLSVTSGSGDITIGAVGETAQLKAASGDITVGRFDGTELTAKTLSGDLRLGLPPRRLLDVDLQTMSGDVRNRLPAGDGSPPERTVALRVTTVSGNVTLRGA